MQEGEKNIHPHLSTAQFRDALVDRLDKLAPLDSHYCTHLQPASIPRPNTFIRPLNSVQASHQVSTELQGSTHSPATFRLGRASTDAGLQGTLTISAEPARDLGQLLHAQIVKFLIFENLHATQPRYPGCRHRQTHYTPLRCIFCMSAFLVDAATVPAMLADVDVLLLDIGMVPHVLHGIIACSFACW